jgi:hypothetical protein
MDGCGELAVLVPVSALFCTNWYRFKPGARVASAVGHYGNPNDLNNVHSAAIGGRMMSTIHAGFCPGELRSHGVVV